MIDPISNYIDRAPLAISGQRGHDTTLRVARSLYNGFALSRDQVLQCLRVYNARLSEKWSERDLAHKADSAEQGKYDKPRGWMLKRGSQEPPKITIRPPTFVRRYVLGPKKRAEIKSVRTTDPTDRSGVIITPDSEHTTETTDIFVTTRNARAHA